ncbi:MAG: MarR family winged helix-turn-helix transcriptional regulator [Bacteroidota bacterium]
MNYNLHDCIGSRFRRISRIIDAYFRVEAKKFGITENQMTIMFALYSMGKVAQHKIGDNLALEKSTVSRNLRHLEKNGYVVRDDAYHPEVDLTPKGKNLVLELIPLWEKVMSELVKKLDITVFDFIAEVEKKL